MPRDYSAKTRDLLERLNAFFEQHIYPERRPPPRRARRVAPRRKSVAAAAADRRAEGQGAQGRAVEHVPAARLQRPGRHLQPRLRAAVRGDGPGVLVERSLQLLGARHRQHGNAGALRHRCAEAALARAAARRRDPLGVSDDRARRRLVGRDQHPVQHPARRQPVRHQRPQVVLVGRGQSALRDLHRDGQDRPRRAAPRAAVDGAGAARHARASRSCGR